MRGSLTTQSKDVRVKTPQIIKKKAQRAKETLSPERLRRLRAGPQ